MRHHARKDQSRPQARVLGSHPHDTAHAHDFEAPGFKRRGLSWRALLLIGAASGAFVFGLLRELVL
jgi:hypothetical protein